MTIIILGRQPAIGFAELESCFGADKVQKIADQVAEVHLPPEIVNKQELGGAIKVAELMTTLNTTDWAELLSNGHDTLLHHLDTVPAGKIKLGLSVYGLGISVQSINKASLRLKKAIKLQGRSVRIIPNVEHSLNSAQVLHNKLTAELGIELLFIKSGSRTLLAQTIRVQNIENYTLRDRGRPMRDAFVGMLPPKLAQIMVHLAVGQIVDGKKKKLDNPITNYHLPPTILDPFCGTGVILQEAALYGYNIYGTDKSEKMVRFTHDNLEWLQKTHFPFPNPYTLETADATDYTWQPPIDNIVCEAYLGQPMSSAPTSQKLDGIVAECDLIARTFLTNLATQVKTGSRHCVALPAWHIENEFYHLPVIDDLEKLGYNRIDFKYATQQDLIYHRPDQIVARELLVLIRK